jgi:Transposase DDE domain group 1
MSKVIKITSTDKSLSAYGGLILASESFKSFNLKHSISRAIPALKSGNSRSLDKFEAMILGSMAGAECLADLETLGNDPAYEETVSKTYTAKSYGNYLRAFTDYHCKTLQYALIHQSFAMRVSAIGKTETLTIDVDSTSNRQYGKKMEGVETNYKNIECLDTLKAFDEYGLPYWHEVRPGATHTSVGAAEVISSIFSRMSQDGVYKDVKRFLRGDSGYCNVGVFNACHVADASFVTHMRHNMLEPRLPYISK